MADLSITIDATAANAKLRSITQALNNRAALHGKIAADVRDTVRNHLETDYVPRNERGTFWARVRDSVASTADETQATVTLSELGVGLRYRGGEVTPGKSISSHTGKPTVALSIPTLNVPIDGVTGNQLRPGRAGLLAFIRATTFGETVGYLVEGMEHTTRKGTVRTVPKPGGALMYVLRTITRHRGDPNVIPTATELSAAAMQAATEFIRYQRD